MARKDAYRRYVEAAAVLGEITRARAEELVRELMSTGDTQRAQAQQKVDEVVDRSRKAASDLLDLVRTEVSHQLQALGLDPDDLAKQAADLMRRSAAAGRRAMKDVATSGAAKKTARRHEPNAKKAKKAEKAPGAKKAAKKAAEGTTKKAAAKKAAGAKKAPAKKAAAKKTAGATKAPAKKAAAEQAAKTAASPEAGAS